MCSNIVSKFIIAGITLVCSLVILPAATASADSLSSSTTQPLSITSTCVNTDDGLARWSINNPDETDVTLNWQGAATDDTYVAPAGDSELVTAYDSTDATPFVFSQDGQDDITVQPTDTACDDEDTNTASAAKIQTEVPCVDGTIRSNLAYDWSPLNDYVIVRTANGASLCDDVDLYFSNYTLPSGYDDSGIFDDSSIPQQLFDSVHTVMLKGTNVADKMTINVPDACTDYQLDLYYAPEITMVTGAGHGSQLIYGRIYTNTETDCSTPGMGGGEVTPPVVTPPVVPPVVTPPAPTPVVAAPVALYNTGQSTIMPVVFAIMALSLAMVVKFLPFKRATN